MRLSCGMDEILNLAVFAVLRSAREHQQVRVRHAQSLCELVGGEVVRVGLFGQQSNQFRTGKLRPDK